MMHLDARVHLESIAKEHERFLLHLEDRIKQLQQCGEELRRREVNNELEENEVKLLKEKYAKERLEEKRLAEDLKRQSEGFHQRVIELEKKALELEIGHMRGALQMTAHIQGAEKGDNEIQETMINTREQLKEKEEELEYLGLLSQVLIVKERKENGELQDSRRELEINQMKRVIEFMKQMSESGDTDAKKEMEAIKEHLKDKEEELEDMEKFAQALITRNRKIKSDLLDARREIINVLKSSRGPLGFIGIKRMGELEEKPFEIAAMKKYPKEEAPKKALELFTMWLGHLRDPSWHPFKVIMFGDEVKEIIDEEDERIKILKNEQSQEVYEAVRRVLREMNEYNPSGRYPVEVLWNYKENRKATMKEGVEFIIKQLKKLNRQEGI